MKRIAFVIAALSLSLAGCGAPSKEAAEAPEREVCEVVRGEVRTAYAAPKKKSVEVSKVSTMASKKREAAEKKAEEPEDYCPKGHQYEFAAYDLKSDDKDFESKKIFQKVVCKLVEATTVVVAGPGYDADEFQDIAYAIEEYVADEMFSNQVFYKELMKADKDESVWVAINAYYLLKDRKGDGNYYTEVTPQLWEATSALDKNDHEYILYATDDDLGIDWDTERFDHTKHYYCLEVKIDR